MRWNCAQICFHQYANYLFFRSNWNILAFFTSFQFSSLHYVLFLWKYNSVMGIYAFKRKKKLKKHCFYNHGNSCLFCFTYTYKYANYTSFRRLRWRQKCLLWFVRCLPLDPLFYFDYQSFLASVQNFHSNVLQKERYKKLCNKIKSGNML